MSSDSAKPPFPCQKDYHGCCLWGKYEYLFIVFSGKKIKTIETCLYRAKLKLKGDWLIQTVKLGDKI